MAKGAYIGVNGISQKIQNGYIGVNGVARKIVKAYIGVRGVARLCYEAPWSSPIKDLAQIIYRTTPSPGVQAVGGYWAVYAMRFLNVPSFELDFPPSDWFDYYLGEVENFLVHTDPVDPLDAAGIAISCYTFGYSMQDIMGYNFEQYLLNTTYVTDAGTEAVCYTIISLLMQEYAGDEVFAYFDWLSGVQNENGYFPAVGGVYDEVYTTALFCQACAMLENVGISLPQYREMFDKALVFLSDGQDSRGGYPYTPGIAHTILALSMAGINPDDAGRFVKNGYTLSNALNDRYTPGEGIALVSGGNPAPISNEWGFAAFVAMELFQIGSHYWPIAGAT